MEEYFFEKGRKVYKLKENGVLYSKLKSNNKKINRFKKINIQKINPHQIMIRGKNYSRKKLYYETYHDIELKEDETVRFRNKSGDYSKANLLLKKVSDSDPAFFKKIDKKIYHYNYKNLLIGIYNSQYEASIKTKYFQKSISNRLHGVIRKRFPDYSYMIYEGDEMLDRYSNYNHSGMNTVVQMDLDGNVLNKFGNAKDAADIFELGTCAESHIIKCCRKKRESAYGYKWSYPSDHRKRMKKMVVKYNKNGDPTAVYKNRQDAIKNIPISKSNLSLIINGKINPRKYSIKEVTYDTGLNIKSKLVKEV